jgi:hypothetical protein
MRIEKPSIMNNNTLRVDADEDGVKVSILKDKHFQGIVKVSPGDAWEIVNGVTRALLEAGVSPPRKGKR